MLSAFKAILAASGLTGNGGKFLLAVSGGMDSMCMASLFHEAGLNFAVAHCNFHLRGRESDGDEDLVRQWSENHGVEFHKKDFDTLNFAKERGLSTEMAARELRYRWFSELCNTLGIKVLAVAHNANDNAETLFLNLARGTGLEGLTGMLRQGPVPYSEDSDVLLFRPMLSFTRKQIEGYVMSRSVPYRDDSTNAETEYKRNRIRHLVFPVMEQLNPSFIRTVNREIGYFSQAASIARSYSETVLEKAVSAGGMQLDLKLLENEHNRDYILYVYLSSFGFNSSVISSVCDLLSSAGTVSGKIFRSAEYELLTTSNRLIIRRLSPGECPGAGAEGEHVLEIDKEGEYEFLGRKFTVTVFPRAELDGFKQPEGVLVMDADALKFPFYIRSWKPGDWFRPLGSKGKKKLSDFFTDNKYDRFSKEAAAILVQNISDPHIGAVLGERIDDSLKLSLSSTDVIKITL